MRSGLIKRAVIVTLILLPTYILIGILIEPGAGGWLALAVPFILIWLMPIVVWSRMRDPKLPRLVEFVSHGAYLSMGVVSFLLVFSLTKTVLNRVLPSEFEVGPISVFVATLAAMAFGMYRALRGPRVKHVTIKIDKIPVGTTGISVVQISDLHVGPTVRRRYVEKVVRQINELKPDLVLLTGDIGDGDPEKLKQDTAPLAKIAAAFGVFYAPGNHEYYWNIDKWIREMQSLGIRTLMNEGVLLRVHGQSVYIAGVTDPAAEQIGEGEGPNPEKALQGAPREAIQILLSHRPGLARAAAVLGFDLQLSGHTHGGQFFPWTLVSPFVHEFNLGLAKADRMWIYVNSGTGSWGPQLRLGTIPEITCIHLEP